MFRQTNLNSPPLTLMDWWDMGNDPKMADFFGVVNYDSSRSYVRICKNHIVDCHLRVLDHGRHRYIRWWSMDLNHQSLVRFTRWDLHAFSINPITQAFSEGSSLRWNAWLGPGRLGAPKRPPNAWDDHDPTWLWGISVYPPFYQSAYYDDD